jgi:hypothetical protein
MGHGNERPGDEASNRRERSETANGRCNPGHGKGSGSRREDSPPGRGRHNRGGIHDFVALERRASPCFAVRASTPQGVRRVFGEGRTADAAEHECPVAAQNYVRRRPDTGPLADWTFRPVPPDLVA